MTDQYPTLLHRWFDLVWNQQRPEAIDEMLADDVVMHGLSDEPMVGRDAFKVFYESYRNAFPDVHVTIDEYIQDGDRIAARCTVRGSHQGDTLGFAATNNPVFFTGMGMCHTKDGRFTEVWNEFNFMKMHSDLGTLHLDLK